MTGVPQVQFAGAAFHSLRGQGVIVTGGASGIGADIVRAFAEQGCRVGFVERFFGLLIEHYAHPLNVYAAFVCVRNIPKATKLENAIPRGFCSAEIAVMLI